MTWIQQRLRKRKQGSLTRQIAVVIIGLVAGTVFLCWLLNTVFLERFYVKNKQNTLMEGFAVMDAASISGLISSQKFDVTFENLCANGNLEVIVIQSNRKIVRASVNDPQKMSMELTDVLFGQTEREYLIRQENYQILKRTDTRLNSEYLMLYGVLSNGNLILMRSALESIRESVDIANQFLAYIAFVACFVGIIVAVMVSRGITNPILEMTYLSKRMAALDFEAKYRSKGFRKNEIDELGEHMNALSNTLEKTISELKSANNQLLVDIEKKTQIEQMRTEFLSNVSHELKTPLALIQGYAEGLKECINDDEQSRDFYCEVIMDEADKMNRMVKKLLTLNQLESGGETVNMERFDLTELISGVLHSVEILLNQNGIRLTEYPVEPLFVWADEFMVEEVVTNYMSNAIHYADGAKEIAVRYMRKGDCVRVGVFNTGNPIPKEDVDQIWNKFYKVDKARTREYGGSGIGLSIVKAIMESFHQECGVVNYANGVEFWFELDAGGFGIEQK